MCRPKVSRSHRAGTDGYPAPDLTNAIKIRRGKENLVYRTNYPDDKRVLLGAFRKVAEDLAAKKRKES